MRMLVLVGKPVVPAHSIKYMQDGGIMIGKKWSKCAGRVHIQHLYVHQNLQGLL